MEQYYKSYYLKDYNKVDLEFVRDVQFGLRVFISSTLNIKVGEVLNDKQEISFVIYYSNAYTNAIQDYHKNKYSESVLVGVCDELINGTKISFYKNNQIAKHSIETYYQDGKPKLRQEFNKDFELVEYVQCIYDAEGTLIEEKFFYADSWTTHREKMI
jgi:hypothetical protein